MPIENTTSSSALASQQAAILAAQQAAQAAEQAAQAAIAAQAQAQAAEHQTQTIGGDGSQAAGEALMSAHAGPLGDQALPPPPEEGPTGGGVMSDVQGAAGALEALLGASESAHMMFHHPESALGLAHKIETFLKDDKDGANKATREFLSQQLGKAKTGLASLKGAGAIGDGPPPDDLSGERPTETASPATDANATPGETPAQPGNTAPEATAVPAEGASPSEAPKAAPENEAPAEAPAGESPAQTPETAAPEAEEPFGNLTKLGKAAGVAGGLVGVAALPAQFHEAVGGISDLIHGKVDEESIKAATTGTLGTTAAVGGIAEGTGVVLKSAGLASGALPALESISKVAGPAGGAVAAIQGGFDLYDGIKNGKPEQAIEGGAEVVGGGLVVAGAAFPPLAIAGGAILLGTAIYKDRKAFIQAGKDVVGGFVNAGKDEVQALGDAVHDGVSSVVKAGSDLSHGNVVGAAVDVGKGAVNTAVDVGKGVVHGAEDVAKGIGHAVSSVFSGW
ncbi:MAG TPA: hypothetical protein V6D47_00380 [Oscillatoriaceae cyanobacterium]